MNNGCRLRDLYVGRGGGGICGTWGSVKILVSSL